MDTFSLIVLGSITAVVLILLALGRWSGVSSQEITGRKQRRAWGTQAAVEERDVGEMVEGQNAYRRGHGERDLSEEEVRARVGAEELSKLDAADREMRGQGR